MLEIKLERKTYPTEILGLYMISKACVKKPFFIKYGHRIRKKILPLILMIIFIVLIIANLTALFWCLKNANGIIANKSRAIITTKNNTYSGLFVWRIIFAISCPVKK